MKVEDTIANQSSYYLSIIMHMLTTHVSSDYCLGLMDQMIHKLRLIVYENLRSLRSFLLLETLKTMKKLIIVSLKSRDLRLKEILSIYSLF